MSNIMASGPVVRVASGDMSGDLADTAGKLIYFVSPDVTAVAWSLGHVDIHLDPRAGMDDRAAIERDVTALLARLRKGHRTLPAKRIFERRAPPRAFDRGGEALTAALVEAGFARPSGPGAYAFGPRFVALLEAVDTRLRRLACDSMSAAERAFPPLIPADVLRRAGYLGSFPQNVSFVSHLPQRIDVIERFREANADAARFVMPADTPLPPPSECLPPAVCHHRFHELAGDTLSAGSIITARGACFRYEARHNMRDLSRLWCFQMREIVYVGEPSFVRARAACAARALEDMMCDLDLSGVCETASDPFFADVFAEKRYAQLAHDRKLELRAPLGAGETLAIASINAHEEHFARAFGIARPDGAQVISGCTAFGLERLALAFLAQHGLDEAGWPAAVAALTKERARGH